MHITIQVLFQDHLVSLYLKSYIYIYYHHGGKPAVEILGFVRMRLLKSVRVALHFALVRRDLRSFQRCELTSQVSKAIIADHDTRWWFQTFFMFTPNLGEVNQFDEHIFRKGLVQPPTS